MFPAEDPPNVFFLQYVTQFCLKLGKWIRMSSVVLKFMAHLGRAFCWHRIVDRILKLEDHWDADKNERPHVVQMILERRWR